MDYVRLYTDEMGESHFQDLSEALHPVDFAPPAPLVNLSSSKPASQVLFLNAPSGWFGDYHPAPRRQYFCFLFGEIAITASDGETRLFKPGAVLLLEDTTGKGHVSRMVSDDELLAIVVQLPD